MSEDATHIHRDRDWSQVHKYTRVAVFVFDKNAKGNFCAGVTGSDPSNYTEHGIPVRHDQLCTELRNRCHRSTPFKADVQVTWAWDLADQKYIIEWVTTLWVIFLRFDIDQDAHNNEPYLNASFGFPKSQVYLSACTATDPEIYTVQLYKYADNQHWLYQEWTVRPRHCRLEGLHNMKTANQLDPDVLYPVKLEIIKGIAQVSSADTSHQTARPLIGSGPSLQAEFYDSSDQFSQWVNLVVDSDITSARQTYKQKLDVTGFRIPAMLLDLPTTFVRETSLYLIAQHQPTNSSGRARTLCTKVSCDSVEVEELKKYFYISTTAGGMFNRNAPFMFTQRSFCEVQVKAYGKTDWILQKVKLAEEQDKQRFRAYWDLRAPRNAHYQQLRRPVSDFQ